MAIERAGRPGRGLPFAGTVVAVQQAAPGQRFALAGFEATAVIQVVRTDCAGLPPAEQTAIVLYGGSLAGLRNRSVVTVYAIRAGSFTHRDDGGQSTTWAVFYAHYIDHGRGERR